MLDKNAITATSLELYYGISGKQFQRQYKTKLSKFKDWVFKSHSERYLIYPSNIGSSMAIDETAFSNGELYTIVTNKLKKGKRGSIAAIIQGTKAGDIIEVLSRIPKHIRDKVKEITLDMAPTMNQIAKVCFGQAQRVTDRFHVQKLVQEAVQEIRIKHRWEALEQENDEIKRARGQSQRFVPKIFPNGDTRKQLLARSRYLLFKSPINWTESQNERARILFHQYPDIQKAYLLSQELWNIYNMKISKGLAFTKMAQWFRNIEQCGFSSFLTIRRTFEQHYYSILNYFDNRSTNAFAESFNSKIKDFRRVFRGVRDTKFFLFRLTQIFA